MANQETSRPPAFIPNDPAVHLQTSNAARSRAHVFEPLHIFRDSPGYYLPFLRGFRPSLHQCLWNDVMAMRLLFSRYVRWNDACRDE